jgi:hypothetical protein
MGINASQLIQQMGVDTSNIKAPAVNQVNDKQARRHSDFTFKYNQRLNHRMPLVRSTEIARAEKANERIHLHNQLYLLKCAVDKKHKRDRAERDALQADIKEFAKDLKFEEGYKAEADMIIRVTFGGAIKAMRNTIKMVARDENKDDCLVAMFKALALMQTAVDRNVTQVKIKNHELFPAWTIDGWQLILRTRVKEKARENSCR